MNIFFIGYGIDPNSGGIERYCHTNLSFIASEKHIVHVYSYKRFDESADGFRIIKSHPRFDRFFLNHRLKFILKGKKIDRILCGHLFLSPIADEMARALNVKYDLFVYGIDCWTGRFEKYKKHHARLDRVVSISGFTTEQIVKQGFPRDHIVYLPPVIDTKQWMARTAEHAGKFVLLTVGRLSSDEQYKGHDRVIEAIPLIQTKLPEIEYRIAGRGDDQPRLEELAARLGVEDRVKFLGFVSEKDLPRLYNESHVFIMPSRVSLNPEKPEGEGFGIVFLEAGIMGKPLIGPETGGSTDIIRDGDNGFNVDPGDPEMIADRVTRLAFDNNLRKTMGKNARRTVLEKFSRDRLPGYIHPLLQ